MLPDLKINDQNLIQTTTQIFHRELLFASYIARQNQIILCPWLIVTMFSETDVFKICRVKVNDVHGNV